MDEQDVKIAVLEREVQGLREQHKEHKEEITKALGKLQETVFNSIANLSDDIKQIYEFINKSKGYYAAVLIISSVLGGTVVAIVSGLIQHFFK